VIDDVTKECLTVIADTSISGRCVVRELDAIVAGRGRPDLIVSDHGTEFTSNAMLAWSQERRITWLFIAPGKPMQNGICEAFNGRMRDELLNETIILRTRPRSRYSGASEHGLQPKAPALRARLAVVAALAGPVGGFRSRMRYGLRPDLLNRA
jgi:transposase InsO family protein